MIDRSINSPGCGRRKIDSINRADTTYFKKKCLIGTLESNNKSMIINAASMISDNNKEFKFKSFSE